MTNWTIRVEWLAHPAGLTDAEIGDILEQLKDLSPALELARSPRHSAGIASVTLNVEAGSLRQAAGTALQLVERATGNKATGVEVLETNEFDRRADEPSIPELVGYAEIAQMAGVTRQRAAQFPDIEDFPPAVVQVKAGPLRVRRQVEAWLGSWERKSGRPKSATNSQVSRTG